MNRAPVLLKVGILGSLYAAAAFGQTLAVALGPPPGKLVDIGGRRLHLNCTGSGSPTVVLEGSAGDLSLVWALVQPETARFTRVCSYDRAGYAWSDPGPQPRTLPQLAFESHTALARAGVPGPYVLVGAGFGGPVSRVFANTYPNDVSGMILVDSIHESGFILINDKPFRLRDTSRQREIPPVQAELPATADPQPNPVRMPKATAFATDDPRSKLPQDLQKIWCIARKQLSYNDARAAEFDLLGEEMSLLYRQTEDQPHPLGHKPLIVLTREVAYDRVPDGVSPDSLEEDRKQLQAKLATLSTAGKLVVVKDTGHEIELYQPAAVVDAIREVVRAVQSPGKATGASTGTSAR